MCARAHLSLRLATVLVVCAQWHGPSGECDRGLRRAASVLVVQHVLYRRCVAPAARDPRVTGGGSEWAMRHVQVGDGAHVCSTAGRANASRGHPGSGRSKCCVRYFPLAAAAAANVVVQLYRSNFVVVIIPDMHQFVSWCKLISMERESVSSFLLPDPIEYPIG